MPLVKGISAVEKEALVEAFAALMSARTLPLQGCIKLKAYCLSSFGLMMGLYFCKAS